MTREVHHLLSTGERVTFVVESGDAFSPQCAGGCGIREGAVCGPCERATRRAKRRERREVEALWVDVGGEGGGA